MGDLLSIAIPGYTQSVLIAISTQPTALLPIANSTDM
jgi:hypothetical protein